MPRRRNGLEFRPLAPATTERLNAVLTVGSLVGNPIDGGFGVLSSADNFMASIDALQGDPNVDMVLMQEGLPRAPGSDRAEHYIRLADDYAATKSEKADRVRHPDLPRPDRLQPCGAGKAPHVSFLQEAYKALRAIASVARRDERERLAQAPPADALPPAPERRALIERCAGARTAEPAALDEAQSKDVLRAYGIATPAEALVTSRADAHRGRRAHRLSRRAQGGVGTLAA